MLPFSSIHFSSINSAKILCGDTKINKVYTFVALIKESYERDRLIRLEFQYRAMNAMIEV